MQMLNYHFLFIAESYRYPFPTLKPVSLIHSIYEKPETLWNEKRILALSGLICSAAHMAEKLLEGFV